MGSLLTIELAVADVADDNDADGNAEGDDSMGSQREREMKKSSERKLKDGGGRRLAPIALH